MSQNNLTPKERYEAIIHVSLTPIMKKHGFKKKGTKYFCKGDKLTYVIFPLKSKWNDKDHVSFYLDWDIDINEDQKNPKLIFKAPGLSGRISDIKEELDLKSFELKQTDVDPITHDEKIKQLITRGIEEILLPFLISFKSIEDIINTLESTPITQRKWSNPCSEIQIIDWIASLYFFINKPQQSIAILDKSIKDAKADNIRKKYMELKDEILQASRFN
jgi:hypothetical protein